MLFGKGGHALKRGMLYGAVGEREEGRFPHIGCCVRNEEGGSFSFLTISSPREGPSNRSQGLPPTQLSRTLPTVGLDAEHGPFGDCSWMKRPSLSSMFQAQ